MRVRRPDGGLSVGDARYGVKPTARNIPVTPMRIQKTFSRVYARSFFRIEHHERITASDVLKTQTNRNGLLGPSQLTSVKLVIRIKTPSSSTAFMRALIRSLIFVSILVGGLSAEATAEARAGESTVRSFEIRRNGPGQTHANHGHFPGLGSDNCREQAGHEHREKRDNPLISSNKIAERSTRRRRL